MKPIRSAGKRLALLLIAAVVLLGVFVAVRVRPEIADGTASAESERAPDGPDPESSPSSGPIEEPDREDVPVFSGLVLDAVDGHPVCDATIVRVDDPTIRATTDAGGVYRMPVPGAAIRRAVGLLVEADGYLETRTPVGKLFVSPQRRVASVVLHPRRFLEGRVVDLAGKAILGASVRVKGARASRMS